jgi:hypothetical protein
MEEKIKDVISKMERLERLIGQLYKVYARVFPSDYSFWVQLSKEEEEHANLVKNLAKELQDGNITFDEKRFKLNAIQTTIRYIQQKINQANNKELTEKEAYSIAWDLENGLLEKSFFKTFQADNIRLKEVLKKLNNDTEEHRNRINKKKLNNT